MKDKDPFFLVRNLSKSFFSTPVLLDVNFMADQGQVVGIIGANGAGKTTLLNCLTSMTFIDSGDFFLENQSLKKLSIAQIAHRGIARTFQNIRLFGSMTVRENILIGGYSHINISFYDQFFQTQYFQSMKEIIDHKVDRLIEFIEFKEIQTRLAATLSYGQQRWLEIVRALVLEPKILVLDEPAAGMNPIEKDRLKKLINNIAQMGVTIILIEHDMRLIRSTCDRLLFLHEGKILLDDVPAAVLSDSRVERVYLG